MSDRERAIKHFAAATGRSAVWLENHQATWNQEVAYSISQCERVFRLERDNAAKAERVLQLERALRVFMYLTSDESGWGTNKRMEGSQLYTEVHEARGYADAALGDH